MRNLRARMSRRVRCWTQSGTGARLTRSAADANCARSDSASGSFWTNTRFRRRRWTGACKIGECIHNLRSALDNLAYALARLKTDPPTRPWTIYFPIFGEQGRFNNNGRASIAQLPPAAADAIERLQPFQRTGARQDGTPEQDLLLLLQALSNSDKHRVPSIVLIAPKKIDHLHAVEFRSEEEASLNVPPDVTAYGGPLSPGVVMAEMRTKHPIASVAARVEIAAVVALETEKGPENLGFILPALVTYTGMVVDQLRGFFRRVEGRFFSAS